MRSLMDRNFSQGFLKVTWLVNVRTNADSDYIMMVNQCMDFCYLHSTCVVGAFSVDSQEMAQTAWKKRSKKEEGAREGGREGERTFGVLCSFHVLNENLKLYLRMNDLKSSVSGVQLCPFLYQNEEVCEGKKWFPMLCSFFIILKYILFSIYFKHVHNVF